MGSTPTVDPIPWQPPPYNAYRDCSLGICTIYCPQWCTLFFPPPPDSSGSGTYFSPLVVSVIVILASALILVSYFTIFKKSCSRRRPVGSNSITADENRDLTHNVLSRNALPAGLEESVIRSITVWKYKKGERVVEGTDCSVCLSEFQDDESLRLLPKCNHAFHLPCIDTWLKSHSNCPLCRANVAPSVNSSPMQEPPPLVPGSPLPTEDEDDMPFSGDEVVVAIFGNEVSASPESASREGQGHVQVAHGVPEQHAEEDGDDGRINPQNIGPSKSFHGDNSTGRANYASESRSAVSPGK